MAREDLDNLLSACIPFAKQMLEKHGEFFPFGATMLPTGEISLAAGYDDRPGMGASEIAELTLNGFRAQSADLKAVALCVDVRVDAPDGSGKNRRDSRHVGRTWWRSGERLLALSQTLGARHRLWSNLRCCRRSFRFCLTAMPNKSLDRSHGKRVSHQA